ncbi:shikimate dehydrogenase, partial [Halomonas sp.]|uniref:shikimate dehydrogenase n=1 Tax=Halomonas sp. TaxID=1486246 RepID=UPI00298E199F
MTDRYCVFGHPVGHSKSPAIHAAFADQIGDDIEYVAIEAPLDDFAGAWRRFVAEGGRGANVTVPFKEEAFRLCDTLSERARRAGAVNTLILGGNGLTYGDTTDGIGLVRDLKRHGVALAGARGLVLGAGGAVRGVLEPLLAEGPASLFVANRTAAKAEALAADFRD